MEDRKVLIVSVLCKSEKELHHVETDLRCKPTLALFHRAPIWACYVKKKPTQCHVEISLVRFAKGKMTPFLLGQHLILFDHTTSLQLLLYLG